MRKTFVKGIEPIIATVIIVAVTLVIAIGVIGWIMGWWGALTGGQEQLQIMPDSILKAGTSQVTLTLHVANKGGGAAVIYKVEIPGTSCTATDNSINPSTISAGTDTTVNVTLTGSGGTCSLTPGATYTVKVYTKSGNVYSINLVAQP